ncbi:hypothetical protein BdWA1_002468 [Babesia duncani]|uniref:Uncharacterized protein n=1 Tax=Babesia duncani TaxID=323732 RepID=A0AAD9PJK3_9APIC|nr:hypothetical protein BdWA1_002468 [Babesia duncani]
MLYKWSCMYNIKWIYSIIVEYDASKRYARYGFEIARLESIMQGRFYVHKESKGFILFLSLCCMIIVYTKEIVISNKNERGNEKEKSTKTVEALNVESKRGFANIEYLGSGYDPLNSSNDKGMGAFVISNLKSPLMDSYAFGNSISTTFETLLKKLNMWIVPTFYCNFTMEVRNKIHKYNCKKEDITSNKSYDKEYSKEKIRIDKFINTDINTYHDEETWNEILKRHRNKKTQTILCTTYSAGITNIHSRFLDVPY